MLTNLLKTKQKDIEIFMVIASGDVYRDYYRFGNGPFDVQNSALTVATNEKIGGGLCCRAKCLVDPALRRQFSSP